LTSILTIGQYYLERHFGRGSSRTQPTATLPGRLLNAIRFNRPHEHREPSIGIAQRH
jgi:hypothetical protein